MRNFIFSVISETLNWVILAAFAMVIVAWMGLAISTGWSIKFAKAGLKQLFTNDLKKTANI